MARALVVDLVAAPQRARALGWFNDLTGWIWSLYGPGSTFTFGAVTAAIAAALLMASTPRLETGPDPARAVAM